MLERLQRKRIKHSVVGIELQNDGVAIAVAKKDKKSGLTRLYCTFQPFQGDGSVTASIAPVIESKDLKNQPTVFVMPQDQYSLLQTSTPSMRPNEMRAAASWKIGELIDYPVDKAVVDIFEYPESGQRGNDRMLYVVSARSEDVQEHINDIRRADLDLRAIDIGELTLRNVVAKLPENEQGVMVLSLAERSGMLAVIKQSEVYLARRFDLGFDNLLLGDERMFDDLVLQLQRSLDFFESHFSQALPAKVLIFPPDKVSGELIMHINSHLKLDVEPLILEQLPNCVIELDELSQTRCLHAIGAALRENEAAQ